jgi:1-acyl-sn-glycerol-3-phosphate acyltransferase
MKRLIRSAAASVASFVLTATTSSLVTPLSFIDEEAPNPVLHLWGELMMRAAGVESQAWGLEHLPQGHFVLAVNHQSHFDAPLIFKHIRRHMRFVAKAQLRRIPVFGYALERAGNIIVDRSSSGADASKLRAAAQRVKDKVSVVFFAEGTRSDSGELLRFKKGAAALAIAAQVPLVPAAIAGTYAILRKGSLLVRPSPAILNIGKPFNTDRLDDSHRDDLTNRAHASVSTLLAQANAHLSAARAP